MKILVIDIETSPNIAGVWNLWSKGPVYPHMVIEPQEVICYAAKWAGEEEVFFRSTHHDGKPQMLSGVHSLLNEADAAVHYNGRKFDRKRLNSEFVLAGLTPPSPTKDIDLIETVKRQFDFESNSLDYICKRFDIGHKEDHDVQMWMDCILRNDPVAWDKMKTYCIGDVVKLTEPLYWRLLPWIEKHPNWSTYTGEICCVNCGGTDFNLEGFAYTQQGRFQRYSCNDCGKWFRDPRRNQGAKVAEAV